MFKKLLGGITSQRHEDRKAELYRNHIRHEAKIGGSIFGIPQQGHRREFFCLDAHTWIWHEEWTDNSGQAHVQTTRYDVRPNGILKAQGNRYQPVSQDEAVRLYDAAKLYRAKVRNEMYSFVR